MEKPKLHFTEDSNSNTMWSFSFLICYLHRWCLMALLRVVWLKPIKIWTFYGKECIMINPSLVKKSYLKKYLWEQSNYDSLRKELQDLKCEYCPQRIYCLRSQRVKMKARCTFRLMKPSCPEFLSLWVEKE